MHVLAPELAQGAPRQALCHHADRMSNSLLALGGHQGRSIGAQYRNRLAPLCDQDFLSALHAREQFREFVIRLTCADRFHIRLNVGQVLLNDHGRELSSHSLRSWMPTGSFPHPGPNEPSGFVLTALLGMAGAFVASFLAQAIGWYRPDQGAGLIGAVSASIALVVWACLTADAKRSETQRAPSTASFSSSGRGWGRTQWVKPLVACLLPMRLVRSNYRGTNCVPRFDVSSGSGSGRRPRNSNRWFQRASVSLLVKSQEG